MNDSDNADSNIYSGLPEFRYDETLDKLHATVAKLEAENGELQRKLDLMKKDKESLESNFKILSTNLSSLLKTARIEVSRKDRTIGDLRKQLFEVLPQRRRLSTKRKNDEVVDFASRKRFCQESDRPSYYSRKPEFYVEDVAKETSKMADTFENPKLPARRAEPFSNSSTPRSAVRAVDSLSYNGEKPLPIKDVPFNEDGNGRPPPLNCPTVFSARMYRRMYNCSTGVAPDPPAEIHFAPDLPVEAPDKPDLNERLSPLVPIEVATELPPTRNGDLLTAASKTQLTSQKRGSSIDQDTTSLKDMNCLNIGDKNSDVMNGSVQPSTDSNAQCSSLVKNVDSFSEVENCSSNVVVSEFGKSQSELTFSVHSQPAEILVNELELQNSPKLPSPPAAYEGLCHFDVKADLRLSDSECSLSNLTSAVSEKLPLSNGPNDHPVTKEPEYTKLNESLGNQQLGNTRRRKILRTNRKTGLKRSPNCPQNSTPKNTSTKCIRPNAKLKFTPISSSWVCSISTKNDAPPSEPSHPQQTDGIEKQLDGLPKVSVTSELKVAIEEPIINETREEVLFGSPLKWADDSCDSTKRDSQQTLKAMKLCSIFGSPLKIGDSGSSDVVNFSIPQNAYEESCWTMQSSQMKDSRPFKITPSAQESASLSEEQLQIPAENPSERVKSIFSPSRDSKSSHRPVTSKIGEQTESSLGLSFPFKSAPKYGDSVLGHYDDTAQFVSALAKDETELSPLSTPSKSHDVTFLHPSSGKTVPSSFKEIFVNDCKVNEIIQPSVQTQDKLEDSCEKLVETDPKIDTNERVETKIVKGGCADQGISNCSIGVLENSINNLSSNVSLRMIPPPNLASSSVFSPTQPRSNAPANRLEPRKTPRIIVRSSNASLKKIETDIPKIALDDEFIAQQEKRWMNSCRSSKKSSGRNLVLAGPPSPKKGHKTTLNPLVDVDGKHAGDGSIPKCIEKVAPISVDSIDHPVCSEEVSLLKADAKECNSIEAAISEVQVLNGGESSVKSPETPQNQSSNQKSISNCDKDDTIRTSPTNPESKACNIHPNETLAETFVHEQVSPLEHSMDLATEDVQQSKGPSGSPLDIVSSVATPSVSLLHPESSAVNVDTAAIAEKYINAVRQKKSKEKRRGNVKVLRESKDNKVVSRVKSRKLNGLRESSILSPIVSSVNAPGKIVIQKPGCWRDKDFKKSSALKEVPQKRSERLAGLCSASIVKEVPTPSNKTSPPKPSMKPPVSQEMNELKDRTRDNISLARRKSESDFNTKQSTRQDCSSEHARCSRLGTSKPTLVRRKSGDDLRLRSEVEEVRYPFSRCTGGSFSLKSLLDTRQSKGDFESKTSRLKDVPLKPILKEKSECEIGSQTSGLEVSSFELTESSSMLVPKMPKRIWRKSGAHFSSIFQAHVSQGRSDEDAPPKRMVFRSKSGDCNFSSKTSEFVSIEHQQNNKKHDVNGSTYQKQGRPAMWPPRRIDLETVGNIYHCVTSSFSPNDPRTCHELSKSRKPIVHVCGIDWNPNVEEKLISSSPLVAKSPKSLDLDVSAISPTRKEGNARRAIAVVTSTPITRAPDQNLPKSPFATRRKPFGHVTALNSGKPFSNIPGLPNLVLPQEHRMMTRNRGRRTIMLDSPWERRTGKSPRQKRSSPVMSGSPKENFSARPEEVKKTRRNLSDQPKFSKSTREPPIGHLKMLKSTKAQENFNRDYAEDVSEPKKIRTSPAGDAPKPKLISLKPRNANFSSLSASSSCSKVIYVGRHEASSRSSD